MIAVHNLDTPVAPILTFIYFMGQFRQFIFVVTQTTQENF